MKSLVSFRRFVVSTAVLALLGPALGCDAAPTEGSAVKSAAAADRGSDKPDKPDKPSAQAETKASVPKIKACDQRDFVPPAGGKPKLQCVDYSEHTGLSSPSCVQGTPMNEPCPTQGVIATCTMSTGTKFLTYEGGLAVSAEYLRALLAFRARGSATEAIEHYREAIVLAKNYGDPFLVARATTGLSRMLGFAGHYDESVFVVRQALAEQAPQLQPELPTLWLLDARARAEAAFGSVTGQQQTRAMLRALEPQ